MRTKISVRVAMAGGVVFLILTVLNSGLLYVVAKDDSYVAMLGAPIKVTDTLDIFMVAAFSLVGTIVSIKRPANLVGWAMVIASVGLLFGGVADSYARLALLAKPESGLPDGRFAMAFSAGSWTPLMAGVFLLILLFPTGRVPSRRWAPVARLVCLFYVIVWVLITTAPIQDPPFDQFSNPLAVTNSNDNLIVLIPLIFFCLGSTVAAVIDLAVRAWRSKGDEREQYKWLAGAGSVLAVSIPFSGTAGLGVGVIAAVADISFGLALAGLPLSVGIAVLKYRLYDIDRILNRTLVYGLVTALLAAVYLGLVVGLQAVSKPVSGSSDLAVALTTLIVAALFLPARRRVQQVVDQRFNRRAYDAALTIERFSARLRENIDLDTLRSELLGVVNETMEPAVVSLWLRPGLTVR